MAWKFDINESANNPGANFLDNVSQFTYIVTGRLDVDHVGNRQCAFGHYGSSARAYFRKNDSAPERMRWSVTSARISQTVDDTWTVVTGETHQWAITWRKSDQMQIYRDGVFIAQSSTAAQTSDYNTGGGVALYVGSANTWSYFFEGTIDTLLAFPGTYLTAPQIAQFALGVPWFNIGSVPRPAVWWDFKTDITTRAKDESGNNRPLATVHAGVTGEARLWPAPRSLPARRAPSG